MSLSISQLNFLVGDAAAELLSAQLPNDPLAAQKILRKQCSAEESTAIGVLRGLRRRASAGGRFPAQFAGAMLATDKLLQQASSYRPAVYVGRRLAELAGGDTILDLCSGLGVDAIGASVAGADVWACDIAVEAVLCGAHNASIVGVGDRCRFEQVDVTSIDLPSGAVVHVDPDRRAAGRRSVDIAEYSPGPEFLRKLTARTRAGAMKLSPALDIAALDDWPGVELEYISEAGVCKQLVLWWGSSRRTSTATVLGGAFEEPSCDSIEVDALGLADIAPEGPWLIEPDPAVLAAGAVDTLARRHRLWRIDANLAWLFGEERIDTPLARCYAILREVPGRLRDVGRAIKDLDGGEVTVKPRNLKLDTDLLQRKLRGRGSRSLTVLWCKTGLKERAFIAAR